MGYWGVKSYENDLTHDALDAGFDKVHEASYEALMDDRNPLPYEKVHEQLANQETLDQSLAALDDMVDGVAYELDDESKLAWVGVVIRHVECRLDLTKEMLQRAISILENEDMEWPRPTERKMRLEKELALLRKRLA
ncbi:MAG: hypothetical protein WCJ40_05715 [Planctomycetota bacterium]|nr:hypothetical protein [Planctomycetota bacterium]